MTDKWTDRQTDGRAIAYTRYSIYDVARKNSPHVAFISSFHGPDFYVQYTHTHRGHARNAENKLTPLMDAKSAANTYKPVAEAEAYEQLTRRSAVAVIADPTANDVQYIEQTVV